MTDLMAFLKLHDEPCTVTMASNFLFGTESKPDYRNPSTIKLADQALKSGFVEPFPQGSKIPGINEVTGNGIHKMFFAELILTESGRIECGLPPLVKPKPVEKPQPKKQKAQRQQSLSLFDD